MLSLQRDVSISAKLVSYDASSVGIFLAAIMGFSAHFSYTGNAAEVSCYVVSAPMWN